SYVVVSWFLSTVSIAQAQTVIQDVSYSDVLEQQTKSLDKIVSYGETSSHIIAVWEAAREAKADVLWIHGGCWLSDFDASHTNALSTALSDQGYNVYSIEYRRTGDTGGGWPTTYNDVQAALDKVQQQRHSERPLLVSGHSAGGHLALLLASANQQRIDGVIGLAAITDIERYAKGSNSCEQVTDDFMGGTPTELASDYNAANPRQQHAHPMTVLLHGSEDAIVSPDYMTLIDNAEAYLVEGAGHFDWVHPQTPAFAKFLEILEQL